MRVVLDQGCPRSAVRFLAAHAILAEHVGELGLAFASDDQILEEGRRRRAIVVTLDSDFHRALALSGLKQPSVIRIRIQGLKGAELAEIIYQTLTSIADDLAAGAMATVSHGRIRVRRLPLSR
jgi:predicted nuclease of predicted toxin-antitoxin system